MCYILRLRNNGAKIKIMTLINCGGYLVNDRIQISNIEPKIKIK